MSERGLLVTFEWVGFQPKKHKENTIWVLEFKSDIIFGTEKKYLGSIL